MPTDGESVTTLTRTHDALTALSELAGQMGELLEIVQDREQMVQKLGRLALIDELTGLYNRRGWEENLPRELARASRERRPLYIALFDLDNFKSVNDTLGHPAGDKLLKDTAAVWSSQLRAHDLLARYGGEEFALQFIAWPQEAALRLVERLRRAVPSPQTCSAGLAQWNGQESAEELYARADLALLEAKHTGRDRTVVAAALDVMPNGAGGPEPPEPPPERRRGPAERRAHPDEPGEQEQE
jgi:diguanylate cyclase (GGDEF)-like protein